MRDVPFWFSFAALGALAAMWGNLANHGMRVALLGSMLIAYILYVAVRLLGVGDAAAYDSTAFFGYAALLCFWLLMMQPRLSMLASIGSGSYFIYLWHIFIVLVLRDHSPLNQLGAAWNFAITCSVTALLSILALLAIRQFASPRVCRWLGA